MEKRGFLSSCSKKAVALTFTPETTRSVECTGYNWSPGQVTGRVDGKVVITATRHIGITDFRVTFLCLCGNKPLDPLKLKRLDHLRGGVRGIFFTQNLGSTHVVNIYKTRPGTFLVVPYFEMRGTQQDAKEFRESFSFNLKHVLPETLPPPKGSEIYLKYVLVAWCRFKRLDGCRRPRKYVTAKTVQEVVLWRRCSLQLLCENLALEGEGSHDPYMPSSDLQGSSEVRWVGCGGRRGVIQCRVVLPYKGLVRGELVPALVYIFNSSCYAVSSASLHFMQKFLFTANCKEVTDRAQIVRQELSRVQLERVASDSQWQRAVLALHVPATCRTDRGSISDWPYLAARFFVRLKVKYRLCSTMTCDVECFVGMERSDHPVPKPTINLDRLHIYPADFIKRTDVENLPFALLAPLTASASSRQLGQRETSMSEDTPLLA